MRASSVTGMQTVILSTIVILALLSLRTDISTDTLRINDYVNEESLLVKQQQEQTRSQRRQGDKPRRTNVSLSTTHEHLRFLNFGTSVSWGAGLQHRHEAYPYLLSPNVTNLAIRAQGPCYPSVCTQTLVGNEAVYDVITLEFFTRSSQGLVRLGQRLRSRYPFATIIVIQRWNPIMYKHVPSNLDFATWMETHGYKVGDKQYQLDSPKLHLELFQTTRPEDWVFGVAQEEQLAQLQAVRAVGGILLELPQPNDFRQALVEAYDWFAPDMNHLAAKGHLYLANKIKDILDQQHVVSQNNVLGSWNGQDDCESWFTSGITDLQHNLTMVQFDTSSHKHALQVPPNGGYLHIVNPFDKPQSLFLTYMVTGPPPSIYPETFVFLQNDINNPILLDPTVDTVGGPKEHVAKTTYVGVLPPGESTLYFEYWNKQAIQNGKKPFRLTGYAIVGLQQDEDEYHYQEEEEESK